MEEEQILVEFSRVKQCLATNHMDDDTFEAARETCLSLGGKLGVIRRRQDRLSKLIIFVFPYTFCRCYMDVKDLETTIDKHVINCNFEEADLNDIDLEYVRSCTPVRQISPTPLERHR